MQALGYSETAANSAGSALERYGVYQDSLEAKTNELTAAIESLSTNTISEGLYSGIITATTNVVEFIDKTNILKGTLAGLVTMGISKTFVSIATSIISATRSTAQLTAAMKLFDNGRSADNLKDIGAACKGLSEKQLKLVLSTKGLTEVQRLRILEGMGVEKQERQQTLATLGFANAENVATASTFSLKGALNTLSVAFASNPIGFVLTAISALATIIPIATSAVSAHNQKLEEARQKASELADAYKQQQSSLDSQIEKYKELKETLDNGNLSTDESRSIKEQLLEIQKSLIESYGDEASNIDLVNGKYREQLGLLSELSKEKATNYVIENRDTFEDAKKELEKLKTYEIAPLFTYDAYEGKSDIQKQLYDYINSYSNLFDIRELYDTKLFSDDFKPTLFIKANVEDADEIMHQFAEDLEKFGKDNNIDVSGLLEGISEQLKKTWTDELKEYKEIYDEFMKAEIVRNDTLRPLYQQSIQAVEDYNNALSSGEGIAEAKANLDSLQQSVQNATVELEGSQDIFDDIYGGINKNAEAAYQLSQAFENDSTIQKFAEQLLGLSDIDIKAINLDNENIEKGEEAFRGLLKTLGYTEPTEEQIQNLTDKLVELGYVIGEMVVTPDITSTFDFPTYKDQIDDIQSSISTLRSALDSLNSGELDKISVIDLMQQFPELTPYIDLTADGFGNLSEGLSILISQQPDSLIQSLQSLKDALSTDEERQQVDLLIDSLQRLSSYGDSGIETYATTIGSTWDDTANVIEGVTTQFENLAKVQEAVADGLTMSATAAAELAKMYPEILTNAEVTADGQITLNEEVVKNILDGDKSIVDAQITKLEADKAELEAKKAYAEAQLEIVKQVGEGEGKISEAVARYKLELLEKELENEIAKNNQAGESYAQATENMAQNTEKLGNYEAAVSDNMAVNMSSATAMMADAMAITAEAMQKSLGGIMKKAADVGAAVASMMSGKVAGGSSDTIYEGQGGTNLGGINKVSSPDGFTSAVSTYTKSDLSLKDFQSQLEVDIKGYTDAISNIDAQIEVLKNLQLTFDSNGGIGGHGYADKIKELENEKKELTDALKDSTEETAEELNWIEKLINRASSALDKLKDRISNTYIGWSVRNSSLMKAMEKMNEIISIQQQAYERYMKEAESAGLSQEYISRIQNGTLDIEEVTDEALSAQISHYTEWYEKALDCADAIEELKTQLSDLAKQRFDSINTYFSSLMATTEKSIGRLETKEKDTSRSPSAKVYRDLRGETQNLISYNIQKAQQLEDALDSAVDSGYIEAGSEAWRDMYNEILDVRNATEDYKLELQEISKREYEALLRPFDMELTRLAQRKSIIDSMTERLELQGYVAAKGLYERQLRDSESRLQTLKEQADQLQENFQNALSDGMEIGSDDWIDMKSAIDDNVSAVMELENSMIELNNAIRELEWDKFDRFQKRVSRITDESDFMIGMLDKDDKYGEDGKLTDAGKAVIGLHAQNYFAYKEQAEAYKDEIEKINKELADDPTNTTLADRKNDLVDAYQNATKAAYDEYQAVIGLAEDGYQKQIDSINELIDAKKKQLDADKELYSYQKSIAEKTKNIADIQKQLSALSGDDSEENKAKIQKLNADLMDAQKDLEETQYDKWHSDQTEMLDRLADEYAALISEQSQNEQATFQEMIEYANANAQDIRDTITATAEEWGYNFSYGIDSMLDPVNGMADIGRNIYEEIQRLYELTERMYRVSADLGDLGVTDHGMETTISDESTARNFIERLYNGLLGRESDEEGMNMWLERLTNGATVQEMLEGFLNSEEYKAMGKSAEDTIHDFYKGLLGRNAEADGFSYWMEQYRRGMSLSDIGTHGFLNSEEFLSRDHWIRLLDAAPATDGYTELAKRGLLPIDSNILLGAILAPQTSIPEYSGIPNAAGIGNTTFGDINISIPIEHVNDYNDFVTQLQGDGKFEKMIQDMTIGQLAGKSSLAKNSYRW